MAIARSMGEIFPEITCERLELPREPYKKPVRKLRPKKAKKGEIILENVTEEEAALVMAIVAYKMGRDPSEILFRSIRQTF